MEILRAAATALNVFIAGGFGPERKVVGLHTGRVTGPVLGEGSGGNSLPPCYRLGESRFGTEQVKPPVLVNPREEFLGVMFFIGKDQRFVGGVRNGAEDLRCHVQQFGRSLANRLCGRTQCEANGLASVAIQEKKGLRHFGGFFFGVKPVPTHVALAITGDSVRVQGQQGTAEMVAGTAQLAQADLELLGLRHRVSG